MTPNKYANQVAAYLDRTGMIATKLHFPGNMGTEDSIPLKNVMATLTAVREAVGKDKILAWDPYPGSAESATTSLEEANQMIHLMDELNYAWFEGPLPPVSYETQIPKYAKTHPARNLVINLHWAWAPHAHLVMAYDDSICPVAEFPMTEDIPKEYLRGPYLVAPDWPGIYCIE